jgi:hypothetical protein
MLNGLEPIALQPGYNWNNTTIKERHSGACVRAQIYRRHHFWPFHHLLRAHDVLLSQIVLQRSRADVCIYVSDKEPCSPLCVGDVMFCGQMGLASYICTYYNYTCAGPAALRLL